MPVFDSFGQIGTWRRWKCDPKLSWFESMMGQDQLCQKFRKRHHLGPRYDFFTKKISDLLWTRQSNMYIYNRVYVNTWQEGHFAWWKWRYSLLEVGERQFLDPWHWARISLSCIQCCKHVGARPFLWTFIFPSNMVLSGNSIIWFSRIQVKIARASKFKNATWLRFWKA